MKRINFTLIFFILLFSACKDEPAEQSAKFDSTALASDTVGSKAPLAPQDTTIMIQGRAYTIITTAYLDSSEVMEYYNVFYKNNKLDSTLNYGHNGHYSISLVLTDKLDTLFTTSFDKTLFKKEIYGEILARADARAPDFIAYLPEFEALVFTIEIWVPESDWGQQALVMLNHEGKIIEASWSNSYGGSGCSNEVMISDNGRLMTTCGSIYNANHTIARLDSGKFERVLTEILSDSTVLVIYEQNDTTNKNNAWVLNHHFKMVSRFPYSGYYNILGFVVPRYKESSNHTLYMLDVDRQLLEAVHASGKHKIIFLKDCEKLSAALKNNEKQFVINTEFGTYTFALDTIQQNIRWKTDKTY